MAITIDWGNTFVIDIELEDLALVSGTLYEFDVNDFRLKLHSLQDDEEGIIFPKTHRHNTIVTIVGTEFDRTFEVLPPYSVRFPDLQISVKLVSTNNNVFDVEGGILVQNQAQVIPNNSAGKTVENAENSGLSDEDKEFIADSVNCDSDNESYVLVVNKPTYNLTVRPSLSLTNKPRVNQLMTTKYKLSQRKEYTLCQH